MVKLIKRSLDELAMEMPVLSEHELRMCIGGTGAVTKYSETKFWSLYSSGQWEGGVVEGWGELASNIAVAKYSDSVSSSYFMDGYVWASGCLWHNGYNLDGDYLFENEGGDSGLVDSGFIDGDEDEDENTTQKDRIIVDDPLLQALLDRLSPTQIQLIKSMEVKICVNPELGRSGAYTPNNKTITLSEYDYVVLLRELVHLKQDNTGAMGDDYKHQMLNIEFQEFIIGSMLGEYHNNHTPDSTYIPWEHHGEYERWIKEITHRGDINSNINMNLFYEKLDYYYSLFKIEAIKKDPDKYAATQNSNFNWNWNTYFDFMGIKH